MKEERKKKQQEKLHIFYVSFYANINAWCRYPISSPFHLCLLFYADCGKTMSTRMTMQCGYRKDSCTEIARGRDNVKIYYEKLSWSFQTFLVHLKSVCVFFFFLYSLWLFGNGQFHKNKMHSLCLNINIIQFIELELQVVSVVTPISSIQFTFLTLEFSWWF